MHVHVSSGNGEAKFWLEPIISLAQYAKLNKQELKEIQNIIEDHADEISSAWQKHFQY